MKFKTWVHCNDEHEVEVHISAEDLESILGRADSESSLRVVKSLLSDAYGVLRTLPDSVIEKLDANTREIVVKSFEEQIARFKVSAGDLAAKRTKSATDVPLARQ